MADPTKTPFVPSEGSPEQGRRVEGRQHERASRQSIQSDAAGGVEGLGTSDDGTVRRNRMLAFAVAAAIFFADQLTKWIVISPLALQSRRQIELLPFFNLTWVENRGVSMGFLTAASETQRWMLVAMTAAIAVGVLVWLWRERSRGDSLALALVLGGALGNIVDRVRYGYVADFADLHFGEWRPFLIFNVADAAITIGVLLLLARALLTREKKSPRKEV